VVFAMFVIAAITSIASTSYISNQEIDKIILKKSQQQASLLVKNVEYVLEKSSQPEVDLQSLVTSLKSRPDITYAIVINKQVKAIAHSDEAKLNKVYDDSYTVKGATEGVSQYSKWYAEVQKVWVYDIMSPIYVNGALYGTVDIGIPITEVSKAAADILMTQLVTISGIFIICICILIWIMNRLFKYLKVMVILLLGCLLKVMMKLQIYPSLSTRLLAVLMKSLLKLLRPACNWGTQQQRLGIKH